MAHWRLNTDWAGRAHIFRHWLDASFVGQLRAAIRHFEDAGVAAVGLENAIALDSPRPFDRVTARRVRSSFQRRARAELDDVDLGWLHKRVRAKLARWDIPVFPRVRVGRMLATAARLAPLAPPRVQAAVWKTRWNGWVTQRRMQSLRTARRRCIFRCAARAEDSIEHYACCPRVAQFARSELGLAAPAEHRRKLLNFLVLDQAGNN